MFRIDDSGRLIHRLGGETLCVQAWGENVLRVRAVQYGGELEGRDQRGLLGAGNRGAGIQGPARRRLSADRAF